MFARLREAKLDANGAAIADAETVLDVQHPLNVTASFNLNGYSVMIKIAKKIVRPGKEPE
jgi:hypothetical protein